MPELNLRDAGSPSSHSPSFGLVPSARPPLIGPVGYTLFLLALLSVFAAAGALAQHSAAARGGTPAPSPNHLKLYLGIIALEWGLVYSVWKGALRPMHLSVGDLIGRRERSVRAFMLDIGLGFGLWLFWGTIDYLFTQWATPHPSAPVAALLPQGAPEIGLWIVAAASAGISEEIVYRGYLQKQFHALSGHLWVGILAQAVVFGATHGYQGSVAMLRLTLYGILFGVLAWWRGNLRPNIIGHVWTDVLGGLLARW